MKEVNNPKFEQKNISVTSMTCFLCKNEKMFSNCMHFLRGHKTIINPVLVST